jgi:hypothetical protein
VDGTRCEITDTIKLHVRFLSSWDYDFKILKGGIFPAILGLDFLTGTRMTVDVALQRFSFSFAPDESGKFCTGEGDPETEPYLQGLCAEIFAKVMPWKAGPVV